MRRNDIRPYKSIQDSLSRSNLVGDVGIFSRQFAPKCYPFSNQAVSEDVPERLDFAVIKIGEGRL